MALNFMLILLISFFEHEIIQLTTFVSADVKAGDHGLVHVFFELLSDYIPPLDSLIPVGPPF